MVIDETALLVGEASADNPLFRIVDSPALIWSVVGFLVINVLLDFAETLQGFEVASLRDRMEGCVRSLIYEKVANFEDISLFEDPQRLNALQLAEQSIPRMQRLALIIGDLMTGFFVPALTISLSIAGWVPPLIFVSSVPSVVVKLHPN